MTDKDEPILITVQEVKIVAKLLIACHTKRERYGVGKDWLFHAEAIYLLKDFKSNAVRSTLDKLRKKKLIEYHPILVDREWGGAFRFTKKGEMKIKAELENMWCLSKKLD